MADKTVKTQSKLDALNAREEKILRLLREERRLAKEKFPLLYTLLATFGLVATFAGFNKLIEDIEWLNNNPFYLIGVGLLVLFITGAVYKKLG